jgi:hypothetical protein
MLAGRGDVTPRTSDRSISRRRRGFEPLGASGTRELPLPPPRARELLLADAWRRVAGTTLAARARAVRVERGVLEIEVPERRWADALREQLRELASRASALAPELHIRKLRVHLPDGSEAVAVAPLDEAPATAKDPAILPGKTPAGGRGVGEEQGELTPDALAKLRDRYLAKSERKRRGRG